MLSRRFYCRTVRNRVHPGQGCNFAFIHGHLQTVCSFRLHTDHLDIRIQKLCQRGNARSQSASAHRYENVIYQRKFFNNLHGDRSLSCGNCRIVKRMDKGISMLFCQLIGMSAGLVIHIPVKYHFRPIALSSLHFDQRGCGWHDDHCFCSERLCRISDTLRMISC